MTHVRLSLASMIGPEEWDGYGPPFSVEKLDMFTLGIRVGTSFPSLNM